MARVPKMTHVQIPKMTHFENTDKCNGNGFGNGIQYSDFNSL